MNYDIFNYINQMAGQHNWLDALMVFLAEDIVYILIAILVLFWLTGREYNQQTAFFACLSATFAILLSKYVIGPWVNHSRPFVEHSVHQLISHAASTSFPSDHTTFAFALAFTVWFRHRKWGVLLLSLSLLTGISRIYVGVHYPADIVGGMMLAWISSLICIKNDRLLQPISSVFIGSYRKIMQVIPFTSNSHK